jgi:hypothetical protein
MGTTKTVGEVTLTFVDVSEDSRCPKGEQCLWAGNARIVLEASAGGKAAQKVTLDTNRGDRAVGVEGRVLRIEDIAPLPTSGTPISKKDYVVTLSVSGL